MNQEDIIKMAREAGATKVDAADPQCWVGAIAFDMEELARFAALVISRHDKANRPKPDASEREWLQQIAYRHGGIGDLCQTEFEFGAMVAAAEREACAKVCERLAGQQWVTREAALECSDAIRARGQQ